MITLSWLILRYMLSHKERMLLQKARLNFAKDKTEEEANFDFAMYIFEMFEDRIAGLHVEVYKTPESLEELSDEELDAYDHSGLELIDTITDLESIGYYDFSLAIYPKITEAFGQGVRPGKKLQKS